VIPIATPEEMAAIDAAATVPVETLIARAGAAVAWAGRQLLGGTYGRRIVVLAGKGNNGNDGRVAAERLAAWGARVEVVDVASAPTRLPECDLVIDAAFGTGFRGEWKAPDVGDTPVLAVDIPSGVDGLTGLVGGVALAATDTVTFAAVKPGVLFPPGSELAGCVRLADIGLDTSDLRAHLVEPSDVAAWLPTRPAVTHKWKSAVWVIGGSPGLEGAAVLTSRGALRTGAGYVRWSIPGTVPSTHKPLEVVGTALPETDWAEAVLADAGRFGALVVGNGLGLDERHLDSLSEVVRGAPCPVVLDADALTLLGRRASEVVGASTVLTPHDGEFARLAGEPPGPDRIDSVRRLAAETGAVVLLKGSTTVIAHPEGRVLVSNTGDARLATLGTGDVLAGMIGALVACGMAPFEAAASAAFVHGLAGRVGWPHGLVAGDLLDHVPAVIAEILET
jgi:NAD(P)H-hydrate epimerase